MHKRLAGKKIAICGSRKIEEISQLIENQGGIPLHRPLQGTVFLAEKEVEPDLVQFVEQGADWVVFTTGMGTEKLVELAENLGLKELFLKRVFETKIAARGYKTLATLKKLGIVPTAVSEDGTTKGFSQTLGNVDFTNCKVMIQLHGEEAPVLTQFFKSKGAKVHKILPYRHIEPKEEIVESLLEEVLQSNCDAICFTTATQVHSLYNYARKKGIHQEISEIFHRQTVVAAAVGKVTAEALKEEGVENIIVPDLERMGAMIIELAKFYQKEYKK
ncbi:uroporphyrinogen-III synthase [Neobacillus thermocopriae]|uniref:uroporphyrinogen-III synthase n=1 Tax=Neobacillus thermocopriae TaxID=1215031 RepID=UPI00376F63DA